MSSERLRGDPSQLRTIMPDAARIRSYGTRPDQTHKGPGFFGELSRTDDPELYSTELSVGIKIDGQTTLIPVIVPTLTAEELAHLVDGGQPTLSMLKKAKTHALERLTAQQSPFADVGEQHPLPVSAQQQFDEGYDAP